MRKILIGCSLIALLAGFVFVTTARAFEYDTDGIITVDQVINDDVFLGAETVVMDGTVNGNLFTNGAMVTINGSVNGDLLVFGAETVVNGPVSGSIAYIGQKLTVNGRVGGSVYAMSGAVILTPEAQISRNVSFMGYAFEARPESLVNLDMQLMCSQAVLQGTVGRDVTGGLSAIELAGTVGRDVTVEVEPAGQGAFSLNFSSAGGADLPVGIPSGIQVSEQAEVGGKLTYTSTQEQARQVSVIPSEQVIFHKLIKEAPRIDRVHEAVSQLVTLAALGGLILWLRPAWLGRAALKVRRPLPAIGWGMVVYLVGPVLLALIVGGLVLLILVLGAVSLGALAWSVVGAGIALFGAGLIAITLIGYLGALVVAQWAGDWAFRRFIPQFQGHAFWPLLAALVVYVLLRSIPVVDFLSAIVVTLVGVGAIWMAVRDNGREKDGSEPPQAVQLPSDATTDPVI